MTRSKLIACFISASFLCSCVSELRVEPLDPRLPEYSESGYNTAGAYVDGFPWSSRRSLSFTFIFPTGISSKGDIYFYHFPDSSGGTMLAFEFGEHNVAGSLRRVSLGCYLSDNQILEATDLLHLDNTVIELDGVRNFGQLFMKPNERAAYQGPDSLNRGIGTLYMREVKEINDTDSVRVSGTFGFEFLQDSILHTVYSGRFDYVFSQREIQEFYIE